MTKQPSWNAAALIGRARGWVRRRLVGWGILADAAAGDEARPWPPCAGSSPALASFIDATSLPTRLVEQFDFAPLDRGDRRFVGRGEALDRLDRALAAWREGQATLAAVTGPRGCGLTSLLRQLDSQLQTAETIHYHALAERLKTPQQAIRQCGALFELDAVSESLDGLVAQINALPPRIIVLDDGHHLASRIMGTTPATRTFGAIMVATQRRHQWIFACHEQAWRRLSYLHQVDRYFSEVIEVAPFDARLLEGAIGARFKAAGFELAAEPEASDGQPNLLPDGRLEELHELTAGHPASAFFHLLHALEPATDGAGLRLGRLLPFDHSALRDATPAELFTLAEIAVQGSISVPEHRALFRLQEPESRLLLQRLRHLCLIEQLPGPQDDLHYRLVPLHARIIIARLERANHLY